MLPDLDLKKNTAMTESAGHTCFDELNEGFALILAGEVCAEHHCIRLKGRLALA